MGRMPDKDELPVPACTFTVVGRGEEFLVGVRLAAKHQCVGASYLPDFADNVAQAVLGARQILYWIMGAAFYLQMADLTP